MTTPGWIGSYRIERLLGTGSFATVWLGHDPSLGARVAIKVLAENWSHDLRVCERFRDEARLLWRLNHERVVRVHALGELPDGRPYLVMAWAQGASLRDRLAAGPIPTGEGLRLLSEIAAGVAVLHGHGIVHRDLTPGNVLFLAEQQVVIADLGLAKELAAASGLTARAGTPGYMAPEQDDPLAIVDTRTDVYGLGRLGHAILSPPTRRSPANPGISPVRRSPGQSGPANPDAQTGQRSPDQGPANSGISTGHRNVRRHRPGGLGGRVRVPERVLEVLRTATAHRPADRYRDAAAFGVALAQAMAAPPHVRWRWAGAVAVMVAAMLAADTARTAGPDFVTHPTGRLEVTLPSGWRAEGSRWSGQLDPAGQPEPALVISPAPDRWRTGSGPGAFIGLSRTIAVRTTPAGYLAERQHAGCVAAPIRASHQAGIDWLIAEYSACPGEPKVIVEVTGSGGTGLVYVQIAPPDGSGPEFTDGLLAGVHVS